MSRTQLVLIAVIIFLSSLFFYSVGKSGERERQKREFIANRNSHIHPGANRMEIEA